MRSWWLAITLCACGDVNNAGQAIPDAYAPDAPVELGCSESESECSGTCANLMTDDLHCGSCNNHCSPLQGCLNGSCVDKASRCTSIRLWDPQAPDGLYFNPNLGVPVYCDFTNGITYEAFAMGKHNASYANYTLMSSNDFNNAGTRKAFIALYNAQGGLLSLESGWTSGNCCFKASNAGSGQVLTLGGKYLYPAKATVNETVCGGPYTESRYRFYEAEVGPYAPLPMPDDYFATRSAAVTANCVENAPMPGFFMKRRFGLN